MATKDMGNVGLFRLVRVEDESGVSGTGHVADGVVTSVDRTGVTGLGKGTVR